MNHWLDDTSRAVRPGPHLELELSRPASRVEVLSCPTSDVEVDLHGTTMQIRDLGLYSVLELDCAV